MYVSDIWKINNDNSDQPIGKIKTKPIKKIVFKTVTGWYFNIIFFIKIRYKAYELAFKKTKKSPKLLILKDTPFEISKPAPIKPNKTPKNLLKDRSSLDNIQDIIYTINGVVIIIKEALIGLVMLKPLKKHNILMTTPKRAHMTK